MHINFFSFILRKKNCNLAGQLFNNCIGSLKVNFLSFVIKLLNKKSAELALSWISI